MPRTSPTFSFGVISPNTPNSMTSSSSISDRSSLRKKPRKPQEELFVVQHLLARSFSPEYTDQGVQEYRYLVRWQGYGPEDDTWEPRSGLMEGASAMVNAFDSKEHPFTILQSRGINPKMYLIRYSLPDKVVPPSPLAEQVWSSASQMKARMNISGDTIESAVRAFNLGGRSRLIRPRKALIVKSQRILEILDRVMYRSTKKNSSNHVTKCQIRWLDRKKTRVEWMERSMMSKIFGSEEAKEAMRKYSVSMTPKENPVEQLSEYEVERLRRIEENKDLMKHLGF